MKKIKFAKQYLIVGRKRILALKTKNGKISSNHEQILLEAINFYSELYNLPKHNSVISTSRNTNDIIAAIMKEDVSMAIK